MPHSYMKRIVLFAVVACCCVTGCATSDSGMSQTQSQSVAVWQGQSYGGSHGYHCTCETRAICRFLDSTLDRELEWTYGDRQIRLERERMAIEDARSLVDVTPWYEANVRTLVDWLYGPAPATSDACHCREAKPTTCSGE
jgi:hypothetical protein